MPTEVAANHGLDSPILSLQDVTVTYPGPPEVTALNRCTFNIHKGEAVAIVGPSGSGKSTLLSVLGLLERPTSGDYRVASVDTTSASERMRTSLRSTTFGFVFQAFHLLPDRSAAENVEIPLLYQRMSSTRRRTAAVEALERVGLSHRLHASPTTLSGGERQRVAVARALAAGAQILLCDEPTGNLDSATGQSILALLLELPAQGFTLVMVTHDESLARHLPRELTVRDGLVHESRRPS